MDDLERLKTGDEVTVQFNDRTEMVKAKITQILLPKQGNESGGTGASDGSQGEQADTGNTGASGSLGKIIVKLPDGEYTEGTQGEYSIEERIRYPLQLYDPFERTQGRSGRGILSGSEKEEYDSG